MTNRSDNSAQPLVSIVTPVYNGANFLVECIESVLNQTYQNWEYTIVDNCSTDGTAEIARQYAAKDSRIKLHENQQFLRAIPNHNHALRQISPASKYCKVVFGDDWIFPQCLEQMVMVAEEHPSIGIVSAYAIEGRRVAWTGLPYPSPFVSGRQICRQHFLEKLHVFGSATTVLYRADLVRACDHFFNEANIHADTEVCFDLLRNSDFGFVHQVLTFTRVRDESLTAISNDLLTSAGGMLYTLRAFGREYLSEDEFQACWNHLLSEYYEFLAKSTLEGRGAKFWEYHKGKLNELTSGFSLVRLAERMPKAIGSVVLAGSLRKIFRGRSKAAEKRIPVDTPTGLAAKELH